MNARQIVLGIALAMLLAFGAYRLLAAEAKTPAVPEYVTIRWAGRDNTHIIRPGGQVEFIGHELRNFSKPDRTDDRAFYMNLAMNGLAREGYEFAGMSTDEIVMRRTVAK